MKKPDELVVEIERSIFGKALVISLIAHVVLMGTTSISLFKDWTYTTSYQDKDQEGNEVTRVVRPFFLKSPSYINAEKARLRRADEELARKKAAAEKAAAAAAARAAAAATNKTEQASAPASTNAAAAQANAPAKDTVATQEEKKKTPPEVQPLPPKKDFQYGEDLSLD